MLLKNKNNLTEKQSIYLEKLCQINKPIFKAMLLKEDFLQIYSMGNNIKEIEKHLETWIEEAFSSKLEAFISLATSFAFKAKYILNWFKKKKFSNI